MDTFHLVYYVTLEISEVANSYAIAIAFSRCKQLSKNALLFYIIVKQNWLNLARCYISYAFI